MIRALVTLAFAVSCLVSYAVACHLLRACHPFAWLLVGLRVGDFMLGYFVCLDVEPPEYKAGDPV